MKFDWNTEPPVELTAEQSAELAKLTAHQREVLTNLAWWGTEWVRPMDVGGRNGTHHSATLRTLVTKSLVDSRWRTGPGGKWARGSKTYRLTEKGLPLARACELAESDRMLERLAKLSDKA